MNDTYLAVWNAIPPQRPEVLSAYVYKIARNLAISKHRKSTAKKRRSTFDKALDELENTLSSGGDPERELDAYELARAVNDFIERLDAEMRVMFVRRYFYSDSVSDIAKRLGTNGTSVSVKLFRVRERLRQYLEERGLMK